MLKTRVADHIAKILKTDSFILLTPKDSSFGDYALNTQHVTRNLKHKIESIENLIKKLSDNALFSKVETRGDFINFYINPKTLFDEAGKILEQKDAYGLNSALSGKKIIVEFAHPNTHKLFHIGHLRNIILGESLSRLLEASGAKVIRANYQGDVGLHIAKCLWAILQRSGELKTLKTLDEKIAFLGSTYTQGTAAYEKDEKTKQEIDTINKQIFTADPKIMPLLTQTRSWSLAYFDRIYKRVGTTFDRLFFESEVAAAGLAIAKDALKQGILSESDGAVIFDGKKYDLDTRVFINSLGMPTYEAKELGLAELEFSEFGEIDTCIHVVTPEQTSFFKVTFKVQELLNAAKYKGKQMHFAYEFVDLKEGKMSSRQGNVVTAEWLLNEVQERIKKTYSTSPEIAEKIALAAVKYAFLKIEAKKKIKFDIDESISINGNSGPYLQYAYSRCLSILKKASNVPPGSANQFQPEELGLLRTFCRFPEVVEETAKTYSPHLLCAYLFDLTQKFNLFYEKCPILKAEDELKRLRLMLVEATAQLLKNGLYLLGIEVLERRI